ncbi:hypothetical protein LX36DRAFT_41430 [Colletotrichum falcatum]|nr:hypothetical protein LX36DRAFT_41430 [Colletotrichum falcatum]
MGADPSRSPRECGARGPGSTLRVSVRCTWYLHAARPAKVLYIKMKRKKKRDWRIRGQVKSRLTRSMLLLVTAGAPVYAYVGTYHPTYLGMEGRHCLLLIVAGAAAASWLYHDDVCDWSVWPFGPRGIGSATSCIAAADHLPTRMVSFSLLHFLQSRLE